MASWVKVISSPGSSASSSPPGSRTTNLVPNRPSRVDGDCRIGRQLDPGIDLQRHHRPVIVVQGLAADGPHLDAGEIHVGAFKKAIDPVELGDQRVGVGCRFNPAAAIGVGQNQDHHDHDRPSDDNLPRLARCPSGRGSGPGAHSGRHAW